MERSGGYERKDEYQQLQELERVKREALLELADYEVKDQLIDLTPEGEHWRCVSYIKHKYEDLFVAKTARENWSEKIIDENKVATIAIMTANYYRFEKEFQDLLLSQAVEIRREVELIEKMVEKEEEVDPQMKSAVAYSKVVFQAMFDACYGKKLSDPWQRYFDTFTQPVPSISYNDPNGVALRMMAAQQAWQFVEGCAAHNNIFLGAAQKVGLFMIDPEDKDMVLRLATIIVEIQDIARTDPGEVEDKAVERERRIREYGRKWKVGEKLINTLVDLFNERYLLREGE